SWTRTWHKSPQSRRSIVVLPEHYLDMVVQRRRKLEGGDSDSHTNTGAVATHSVEEYSKHAEECRKLADLTAKPEDKRVLRNSRRLGRDLPTYARMRWN